VDFFHLDYQCYATEFMREEGMKFAKMVGLGFREYNLENYPEKSRNWNTFFPGTLIVNYFRIVYPATAEELKEVLKKKAPLTENRVYIEKAQGEPEQILQLDHFLEYAPQICLGRKGLGAFKKRKWLQKHREKTRNCSGFIGFFGEEPLSCIEFIREDQCPYPIPKKRKDFLFITCIYGTSLKNKDYRESVLKKANLFAKKYNFGGLSVISGKKTPYPNGPESFFLRSGFKEKMYLDRILLKYCWDDIFFMEISF